MIRAIAIADDNGLVGQLGGTTAELLISLGDIWDNTIEKAYAQYQCTKALWNKGKP